MNFLSFAAFLGILLLVARLAILFRNSEEDSISVDQAEICSVIISVILCIALVVQLPLGHLLNRFSGLSPQSFLNPKYFFILIAIILAIGAISIAIMPFKGKWANIRHTTILTSLAICCYVVHVGFTTSWPIAIEVFIAYAIIFYYADNTEKMLIDFKEKLKSLSK